MPGENLILPEVGKNDRKNACAELCESSLLPRGFFAERGQPVEIVDKSHEKLSIHRSYLF